MLKHCQQSTFAQFRESCVVIAGDITDWSIIKSPCHLVHSFQSAVHQIYYVDPSVGWGLTCCFTDVCATPITKGPPAQIFLEWHVFVP